MSASYLRIGGEIVNQATLLRTQVTQELNHHDWCEIETRQSPDIRPQLEESLGKDVQVVTFDEAGAESVIFDGFIVEGEIRYEMSGSFTTLTTAVSRSWKLDCTPQESYWRKKTLSDVAQGLAGQDGLSADVQCEQRPVRNYVQWGETDFDFLVRIADYHQAWVRPTASGIEIRDQFQAGTILTWRTEEGLHSFRMKGRVVQPSFQGTHYNARTMESNFLKKIQKRADYTGASDRMVNAAHRASDMLPSGHMKTDDRAATKDEYQQALERESMRAVGSQLVGHGVSRVERVRAGQTVQIQGAIDAQGTYGVFKVVHRWTAGGYQNDFWCTPWQKYVNPVAPPQPKIEGVVTARVKDQNDPRHMGRLQIQYDWLEDGATAWARMSTPHAGGERGFLFLPEIGDEVLVAFEHGDPERPLIVGSLWNGVDKAPRQEFWGGDVAPNEIKRIVTKSGHRIQMSDKQGKEAIVIATPNNLKVSLFEKTDETGRPMILLSAAKGDIVLDAPEGRIHMRGKFVSREVGE